MLPLLSTFDYLREIIVATSAVHLATLRRCHHGHAAFSSRELVDALAAKQRAFRLLRAALAGLGPASRPVVLVAVVFFINFDLIDSGRGGWKTHMKAAGRLIRSLQDEVDRGAAATTAGAPATVTAPAIIAPLSDMVVADCITYHILGSTLTAPEEDGHDESIFDSVDVMAVLQRTETFSYQCCPPPVLKVLLSASRLRPDRGAIPDDVAASMISEVRSVNIQGWVRSIRGLAPEDDLETRVRLASAHQAATCLYILLAISATTEAQSLSPSTEALVSEILEHLTLVPIDHALAKGTVWPTFMAAAQTQDEGQRQWCLRRLQALWRSTPWVCPWGYVEAAMDMLRDIWSGYDEKGVGGGDRPNWLLRLKGLREERCLIV